MLDVNAARNIFERALSTITSRQNPQDVVDINNCIDRVYNTILEKFIHNVNQTINEIEAITGRQISDNNISIMAEALAKNGIVIQVSRQLNWDLGIAKYEDEVARIYDTLAGGNQGYGIGSRNSVRNQPVGIQPPQRVNMPPLRQLRDQVMVNRGTTMQADNFRTTPSRGNTQVKDDPFNRVPQVTQQEEIKPPTNRAVQQMDIVDKETGEVIGVEEFEEVQFAGHIARSVGKVDDKLPVGKPTKDVYDGDSLANIAQNFTLRECSGGFIHAALRKIYIPFRSNAMMEYDRGERELFKKLKTVDNTTDAITMITNIINITGSNTESRTNGGYIHVFDKVFTKMFEIALWCGAKNSTEITSVYIGWAKLEPWIRNNPEYFHIVDSYMRPRLRDMLENMEILDVETEVAPDAIRDTIEFYANVTGNMLLLPFATSWRKSDARILLGQDKTAKNLYGLLDKAFVMSEDKYFMYMVDGAENYYEVYNRGVDSYGNSMYAINRIN